MNEKLNWIAKTQPLYVNIFSYLYDFYYYGLSIVHYAHYNEVIA